uniref:Uncharacterized protein n=1 Tax=Rhizophora mucronata TaxID=61149 RepID=A0A2P2R0M9_RHIMU
MSLEVLCFVEI